MYNTIVFVIMRPNERPAHLFCQVSPGIIRQFQEPRICVNDFTCLQARCRFYIYIYTNDWLQLTMLDQCIILSACAHAHFTRTLVYIKAVHFAALCSKPIISPTGLEWFHTIHVLLRVRDSYLLQPILYNIMDHYTNLGC